MELRIARGSVTVADRLHDRILQTEVADTETSPAYMMFRHGGGGGGARQETGDYQNQSSVEQQILR